MLDYLQVVYKLVLVSVLVHCRFVLGEVCSLAWVCTLALGEHK